MAEYTQKQYPEKDKERLEKMLGETKESREILDQLDTDLITLSVSDPENIKNVAKKATASGNYLRKKLGVLTAAVTNEKANRYMEIKLECSTNNIKMTESAAKEDAEGYVAPLRTARNVLEAYVISADNVVSFCRMCLNSYSQGVGQAGNEVQL